MNFIAKRNASLIVRYASSNSSSIMKSIVDLLYFAIFNSLLVIKGTSNTLLAKEQLKKCFLNLLLNSCSYNLIPSFKLSELNLSLGLKELSIGMSSDYIKAINHKATYLRIGSAIFGERI